MIADPPVYAPYVLLVVCVLFLAWVFWKRPDDPEAEGALVNTSSTSGANSPAVAGTFNGPVTFNQGPSSEATKPVTESAPYNIEALNRGLENAIGKLEGRPISREGEEEAPKPDLPLNGLLGRIYRHLGGAPDGERERKAFFARVDREIANGVELNGLAVWGHISTRPIKKIPRGEWSNGEFDHRENVVRTPYNLGFAEYRDLRFNKRQVDAVWPPRRTLSAGEKRERRSHIGKCRAIIASWDGGCGHKQQRRTLEASAEFLALRQHMSDDFMRIYQDDSDVIITIDRRDRPYLMYRLSLELERLEREWDLA